MKFKAKHIRYLFFVLAILLAMPLPIPEISGGLMWISPFMFLNSVLAVKSFVLLNILGLVVLALIFWRTRFVCRYVCPLGVVCDWSSNVRKNKPVKLILHKYLAVIALILSIFGVPILSFLDPFNVFHMSFEVIRTGLHFPAILKFSLLVIIIGMNILLPNIWCQGICPLGGMQILAIEMKNTFLKSKVNRKSNRANRRLTIAGLLGIIGGITLPGRSFFKTGKVIRPPSSLPDADFNMVCARCGNCTSACPTNIIAQSVDTSKIGRLLTPVIDFSESYCLPECTVCGDVCPSGAINKFSQEDKKQLFMAGIRINLEDCWLNQQKDCDLCRYHCAYDAIRIKKTGDSILALPVLNEEKCVGCAECKIICPGDAIEMKTI